MAEFKTYKDFEKLFTSVPDKEQLLLVEDISEQQLRIGNGSGWTIGHWLAAHRCLPRKFMTEAILEFADDKKGEGWSVFHTLAQEGLLPEELMTIKILKIADKRGWTVAHTLAGNGFLPRDVITEEILCLESNDGTTVAHDMATNGSLTEDLITEKVLQLANRHGYTTAHELAYHGYFPLKMMTSEILSLEDNNKKNVFETILSNINLFNRWHTLCPELLQVNLNINGEQTSSILLVIQWLEGMKNIKPGALEHIPEESLELIYTHTENESLKDAIDKQTDFRRKIAERRILENISEDQENDLIPDFYFGGEDR